MVRNKYDLGVEEEGGSWVGREWEVDSYGVLNLL